MGIIFFGTPDFALPSLKGLHDHHEDITEVVTQPDKTGGRGHRMIKPPVKNLAEELGIPCSQPSNIRSEEFISHVRELSPEFVIVVAYGRIIPKEILDILLRGCINLHASLLPKYRGAAPIQWAIINGEKETGITTMLMDEGLDTGDILLQKPIPIESSDTGKSLSEKLSHPGAELLISTLTGIRRNTIRPVPQRGEPSYAPIIKKSDGLMDWNMPAAAICNRIRALNPWPGAFTRIRNKTVKILKAEVREGRGAPGVVVKRERHLILISTPEGLLVPLEVQVEGKRPMDIASYLQGQGRDLKVGERTGDTKIV